MKRITILISLLLTFILVACSTADESIDSSKPESIASNESTEASDISTQDSENENNSSENSSADMSEPDASEPDTSEPDTSEPDASEPDTSKPDTSEPDTSEPDTSEPDASESDTSESDTSEPDTSELSEYLDILGFDDKMMQSDLLDFTRRCYYNGESVMDLTLGCFYDNIYGGGFWALKEETFGFLNDVSNYEDGTSEATNMFYTTVPLDGSFKMPCNITFDDTFSSVLKKLGIETDQNAHGSGDTDCVTTLIFPDDDTKTITITAFAQSNTSPYTYEILYTESIRTDCPDDYYDIYERNVKFSFGEDNKLGYFEISVYEEYNRN